MLKGQAEIILTNADGTEQRIVEDNMFTNALKNLVESSKPYTYGQTGDGYTKYLSSITPAWKHMLGGVLLFRDPIPEDVDTIIPPNGNKNTGYASNTANAVATNNLLGSYNTYESGPTDDGKGYTHVWEWNTSQANGTTSCICLTSRLGGLCGWDSDTEPTNQTFIMPLYTLNAAPDATIGSGNFGFNKGNIGNKVVDVETTDDYNKIVIAGREYINNKYVLILHEFKIPIKVDLFTTFGNYYYTKTSIDMQNYYYNYFEPSRIIPNSKEKQISYSYTSGGKTYCVVFDLTTNTPKRYELDFVVGNNTNMSTAVINNIAYIIYGAMLHKVNLTDNSHIEIELPFGCSIMTIIENKLFLFESSYCYGKTVILDLGTDTVIGVTYTKSAASGAIFKLQTNAHKLPIIDGCYSYQYAGNDNPSYLPQIITPYLATINNLATPIIKDNTQTLKVKYTIREG